MSNQEKEIQEFLEEYYENSNESLYKQANALENFAGLVEELMDFRDNIEKRITRVENVIATPRNLTEFEFKQNEEIKKLKEEIEIKRQHISNLCEVIAKITVKSREVKDKSEELYYGVLNGNLRDEKGHMK